MTKTRLGAAGLPAGVVMAVAVAGNAFAVDWDQVAGKDITLFYPGQSSWEWVLTESDHDGAPDIREGKTCWDCHEGEEADIGSKTVSGEKIEPEPVGGKRPAIDVNVKTAHDGEKLFIRLAWAQAETSVERKGDPDNEAKATLIIGDREIVAFQRGGCWSACHDDLIGMPSARGNELTKYLTDSRTKITRQGGDEWYKSDDELQKLLAQGTFLELWQARLNRDSISAVDGYILEKIHENHPPAISVQGGYENGRWVVVFSRNLDEDGPGRRRLESGKVVPIGIAIHDQYAKGRRHHVSFRRTLAIDRGDADFVAVKQ